MEQPEQQRIDLDPLDGYPCFNLHLAAWQTEMRHKQKGQQAIGINHAASSEPQYPLFLDLNTAR